MHTLKRTEMIKYYFSYVKYYRIKQREGVQLIFMLNDEHYLTGGWLYVILMYKGSVCY